ncbi:MAG TPA: DNA-3-methyladenine glycosylase [Terracidiphilus sp.]|nr:DNA-3-methyladenine glycosylase [Terracidiphilus sp.]
MEQVAKVNRSATVGRLPGRLLSRAFLQHSPEFVAPRLLGKLLVHVPHPGAQPIVGRIVEVEAYLGPHHQPPDPAAHSHRGPTPRNRVLFGPAGHAYVYAIYGRYFCMNVSCEPEGQAGCVLLRALEPVLGLSQMAANRGLAPKAHKEVPACQLTRGPGRLCQALGLTRPAHNGLDLLRSASPLQIRDDGLPVAEVLVTPRIGIRHAVDLPLRFALPSHPCVSGPRNFPGRVIFLD